MIFAAESARDTPSSRPFAVVRCGGRATHCWSTLTLVQVDGEISAAATSLVSYPHCRKSFASWPRRRGPTKSPARIAPAGLSWKKNVDETRGVSR